MIASNFMKALEKIQIDTYIGVPDSTLQVLCGELAKLDNDHHICTVNEGAAVALSTGYYLGNHKPCCVYMQNSGMGNALNPIASLTHPKVYAIPTLYLIGYRGEPGKKDEPQHIFQGEITIPLLDLLEIEHVTIDSETTDQQLEKIMKQAHETMTAHNSFAIIVKKGTFIEEEKHEYHNDYTMIREDAIATLLHEIKDNDVIVSTTGKISREVYEQLDIIKQNHEQAFLTVGSMGHASMIALGIAKTQKDKEVYCIDGDGAALMHMGSMAFLAAQKPSNLVHIIINNEAHESVGGMATGVQDANFMQIAKSLNYNHAFRVQNEAELSQVLKEHRKYDGPVLIEIKVAMASRSDLGRPKESAVQNKEKFMKYHEVN